MTSCQEESCNGLLLGLIIFLSFILGILMCKDTETFKNFKIWAKSLGYPRPQGNLPNYRYGLNTDTQEKMQEQWNSVLNYRNPQTGNIIDRRKKDLFQSNNGGNFIPPIPNTILV